MIGHTNLLPERCLEQFRRRRQRRRWVVAYCATCLVLALTYSLSATAFSRVDDHRDDLRASVEERLLRDQETAGLLEEIESVEERLARFNDLAWPVRMSEAVASIAPIVPEGATLTSLTLAPTVERTRIPAKKGVPASETVRRFLTVELQGIAEDDFTVSAIVSGLDGNPLFDAVALDFARGREVGDVVAREFRVQAEIDLEARYVFEDLAEVTTP